MYICAQGELVRCASWVRTYLEDNIPAVRMTWNRYGRMVADLWRLTAGSNVACSFYTKNRSFVDDQWVD